MKPKEREAGHEMNVKIATDVMKWSYWDFEGDYEGAFPMFTYVGESALAVYFDHGDQHIWFDPSHDITAAWMVVEKMIELSTGNYTKVTIDYREDGWRCGIFFKDESGSSAHMMRASDTASLAICRAALMTVEARE